MGGAERDPRERPLDRLSSALVGKEKVAKINGGMLKIGRQNLKATLENSYPDSNSERSEVPTR